MARKSKKIKILFTIPNFDTAGSGKALLKVALSLNKELFVPEILCMHDRGKFFEVVKQSGLKVHLFDYTTQMKPYAKGLLNTFKISRFLKKIHPDIIHSFHYAPDYSEPLAAKMAGITWVYTKKNMNWGGSSANGWKLRSFLARHIVVQNKDMINKFFPQSKKISLISRGVDTLEFYPYTPKVDIRKKYNLNETDRIVICVANLVPVKGIEILLEAFDKIQNKHTNWKLFIVGDHKNDYGKKLIKQFEKINFNKTIYFTGKVLNINDYLNTSELFVLPTKEKGEGSPVALLEAMACGINVIASKIPGIKDQLEKYPDHMFEAGNIEELSIKLEQYMSQDSSENKKIGYKFNIHINNAYKIEHEVEKTEKVYLKLR
ncbi:MAG: glycosyltransferase [Polaribacter sp.]|nr:glycosyltransferase [Polaribacter sp.]